MTVLKHKFKDDIVFKMLFCKFPHLLKKLVAELLGIPLESISEFIITNSETPPEVYGDKFCRLDINMVVNGQIVDLEIQVSPETDYRERSLYYWSREFSTALKKNMTYSELPRTIVISIVDFEMFDCNEFHSEFHILEINRHTRLTDKFCMHYFELPKVPKKMSKDNRLQLWLSLFKAKTEEELKEIQSMEVEEMEQAIQAYKEVTVTPEFMEAERLRAKARHNELSAINKAIDEEKKEDIKSLFDTGLSSEQIAKALRRPLAEVEKLRTNQQ